MALSHGTPMYELVRDGSVDPERYVQIGLRGYWPGPEVFAWQRERGIRSIFMHDVAELGIAEVIERAAAAVGAGPVVISVDVDVLDPAFAPGTGTPEPGGMTSLELLRACRELAERVEVVGRRGRRGLPDADRRRGHHRARRLASGSGAADRHRAARQQRAVVERGQHVPREQVGLGEVGIAGEDERLQAELAVGAQLGEHLVGVADDRGPGARAGAADARSTGSAR